MAEEMSFWEHLDALRSVLIRIAVAIFGCGMIVFCFKDPLFSIIFWPTQADFPLWQLLSNDTHVQFINTELAQQFITHMETSMWAGFLLVSPYVLFELLHFISPALYAKEKKATLPIAVCGYIMFWMGIALSYFIIFPFTFRFLAEYQVTDNVTNLISLSSYIGALVTISAIMGVVFELPVVCGILARFGLLTAAPMRQCRKHAVVAILIVSAIITPTGDAFTLMLVSVPIYFLYELSILVVHLVGKRKNG